MHSVPWLDSANVDESVRLSCAIVGYQFPHLPKDDWCLVRVVARQGDRVFEKSDPALEAQDLPKILDWFRCLADGRLPRWAHLTFVEPCLSFEFLARDARGIRFAVHLEAELRPSFKLRQFSSKTREWVVVFHFDAEQLARVALAVEAAITAFPVRSQWT